MWFGLYEIYLRYPSLSNKLGEDLGDKFTALNFKPNPSIDPWSCTLFASNVKTEGELAIGIPILLGK